MNLRFLKLSLGLVFLISLASLGAIIVFINPYKTNTLIRVLFSTASFLTLFSLFSIVGTWLRRKFISINNSDRILKMVFRQSSLLAIVIISYVWLSHFRILKIWTAIPVFAIAIVIEYYFLVLIPYKKEHTLNLDE